MISLTKRDQEDNMKMSKFYHVYSESQATIGCNLRLDYIKTARKNIPVYKRL